MNTSAITDVATVIIATIAIVVALLGQFHQNKVYKREWRPYLSYDFITIYPVPGNHLFQLSINTKNTGKSILRYDVSQLNVSVNGVGLQQERQVNSGAISTVNATNIYRSNYQYKHPILPTDVFNIFFIISYYDLASTDEIYCIRYGLTAFVSSVDNQNFVTNYSYSESHAT